MKYCMGKCITITESSSLKKSAELMDILRLLHLYSLLLLIMGICMLGAT
jgi:hypothetical protein